VEYRVTGTPFSLLPCLCLPRFISLYRPYPSSLTPPPPPSFLTHDRFHSSPSSSPLNTLLLLLLLLPSTHAFRLLPPTPTSPLTTTRLQSSRASEGGGGGGGGEGEEPTIANQKAQEWLRKARLEGGSINRRSSFATSPSSSSFPRPLSRSTPSFPPLPLRSPAEFSTTTSSGGGLGRGKKCVEGRKEGGREGGR